jgi:uncharacterized membrane protein YbhN (UPF0104 family)
MLYDPAAVSLIAHLPRAINQLLAMGLLAAVAVYLVWTWNETRRVGRRAWSVELPGGRIALFQIGLGILDLGCAALAMYVLIPADLNIDIARVVAVFIAATLLGFVAHTPGGLGVFDATVLVGLDTDNKEALLAVLILFRLFYHLTPFVLALVVFGAREGRRSLQDRA